MAMGLFGIGELLSLAERSAESSRTLRQPERMRDLLPNDVEWRKSAGPILRGTGLGFILGILPRAGAIMASFAAYVMEGRLSREPERFGSGAVEGVAGPGGSQQRRRTGRMCAVADTRRRSATPAGEMTN
jgi:putative tricarboxylic transport membrane protein